VGNYLIPTEGIILNYLGISFETDWGFILKLDSIMPPEAEQLFYRRLLCRFWLCRMDGFHVERQTKEIFSWPAEIGKPVPGEDALTANNNVLTVGAMVFQEYVGSVLMSRCRTIFLSGRGCRDT